MIPDRFRISAMDLSEYICRNCGDQQLHFVASLDGRIDVDRLAAAMQRTMDAQPVLGCRLVERRGRPLWERRQDPDHGAFCELEETMSVEADLWEFITSPVDPRVDPLVSVRVFRAESDTLCVKLEHTATDAGGMKEYVDLLSDTYRRLKDEPDFSPQPKAGGDRTLRQVLKSIGIREKFASIRSALLPKPEWGFPWKGSGDDDRAFAVRRLPPDWFASTRAFCRGRGATFNDILLTAYFRSFFELNETDEGHPMTVQVPIDLRRYRQDRKAEAVCNLSGQLYPAIERKLDEEFTGTLERVSAVMNGLKSNYPGIGSAIYTAFLMRGGLAITRAIYDRMVEGMAREGKSHPFLSNLGEILPKGVDFGDVSVNDAFLVSPILFPPEFLLGISSYMETMTFTLGYSNARANHDVVEKFMDTLEDELLAGIESG